MEIKMEHMEQLHEAYERFKRYYDLHSGIYIYPEFDSDLKVLLKFIDRELIGLFDKE